MEEEPPLSAEAEITEVFDHWKEVMNKRADCRLIKGDDYWKVIEARLKEGFTVRDLKQAINGCARSAFHMGLEEGKPKKFNCLTLICRNKAKVEQFIETDLRASQPLENTGVAKELYGEKQKPTGDEIVEEVKRRRRERREEEYRKLQEEYEAALAGEDTSGKG